jgi:hypothetical protein
MMQSFAARVARVRWLVSTVQWLQILCVAWITWLPVSHGEILYPALAGVLASSVALIVLKQLSLPVELRWIAAVYYAMVAALVVSAFARGNPGAMHQSALWVGVPLIWGSWALTLRGDHLRRTMWALVLSTGVTSLFVVWLGIHALGAPQLFPTWFMDLQQITFTVTPSNQIEMRYAGLSSLIGLAVLTLCLACLPGTDEFLPPMWLLRVAAVLAFIAAVVSGRRGLTVVAVLAPILCVAWAVLLSVRRSWEDVPARKYWREAALGVAGVVLVALSPLGTNLTSMVGVHSGLIEWSVGPSGGGVARAAVPSGEGDALDAGEDVVRVEQASELIASWRSQPLFGHGLGAVLVNGYERNPDRPWMFENQPLQVLMNIGLLGAAVLGLLCWFTLRLVRRAWTVGTLHRLIVASGVTFVLMMLANTTNPYLAAPGHGWVVFLFAGVCVAALADGRRTGMTRDTSDFHAGQNSDEERPMRKPEA